MLSLVIQTINGIKGELKENNTEITVIFFEGKKPITLLTLKNRKLHFKK